MIPFKIYRFISEILYQRRQNSQELELEVIIEQGTKTDIPEDKNDRQQSAMSEISRNIYILSHGHATFVPVAKKL